MYLRLADAPHAMKLHLSRSTETYQINGLGPDHVLVNGQRHESSLVILPDEVIAGWATRFEALSARDFDIMLMRAPEIVLLGSGARLRFPPPALYAGLLKARIGVEVMDTAAACRTYNILAAEGRRVAAALIIETP
jgi:uncharacterized protein